MKVLRMAFPGFSVNSNRHWIMKVLSDLTLAKTTGAATQIRS